MKQQTSTASAPKHDSSARAKERRALRADKLRLKFMKRRTAGKPTSNEKRAKLRASRTEDDWKVIRETREILKKELAQESRLWKVTKGAR